MKRENKRLSLNHETLRALEAVRLHALNGSDLARAAGGQAVLVSGSQIKTCCWPDPPAQGGAA